LLPELFVYRTAVPPLLVITDVPIGFEVVQENGMVQLLFPEEMVQEVVLEVRVPDGAEATVILTLSVPVPP